MASQRGLPEMVCRQPALPHAEAEALVGKRVLTLAAWSSMPQGTTGRVISAVPAGQMLNRYDVARPWDLPTPIPRVRIGRVAEEPLSVLSAGKPLRDWMTKDASIGFLTELPSPPHKSFPSPVG
jgi:hypothetical protein